MMACAKEHWLWERSVRMWLMHGKSLQVIMFCRLCKRALSMRVDIR